MFQNRRFKINGYLGELLFFLLLFHFDLGFLDRILDDIRLNLTLNEGLKKKWRLVFLDPYSIG